MTNDDVNAPPSEDVDSASDTHHDDHISSQKKRHSLHTHTLPLTLTFSLGVSLDELEQEEVDWQKLIQSVQSQASATHTKRRMGQSTSMAAYQSSLKGKQTREYPDRVVECKKLWKLANRELKESSLQLEMPFNKVTMRPLVETVHTLSKKEQEQPVREKRKRKRLLNGLDLDEYDIDDPFIDDTPETLLPEPSHSSKKELQHSLGYYVWREGAPPPLLAQVDAVPGDGVVEKKKVKKIQKNENEKRRVIVESEDESKRKKMVQKTVTEGSNVNLSVTIPASSSTTVNHTTTMVPETTSLSHPTTPKPRKKKSESTTPSEDPAPQEQSEWQDDVKWALIQLHETVASMSSETLSECAEQRRFPSVLRGPYMALVIASLLAQGGGNNTMLPPSVIDPEFTRLPFTSSALQRCLIRLLLPAHLKIVEEQKEMCIGVLKTRIPEVWNEEVLQQIQQVLQQQQQTEEVATTVVESEAPIHIATPTTPKRASVITWPNDIREAVYQYVCLVVESGLVEDCIASYASSDHQPSEPAPVHLKRKPIMLRRTANATLQALWPSQSHITTSDIARYYRYARTSARNQIQKSLKLKVPILSEGEKRPVEDAVENEAKRWQGESNPMQSPQTQ